ncbi:22693_t:CDS:2, partial [Gigaspora margarita]
QRDSSNLNNNEFLSPSFFDQYAHIYGEDIFLAPYCLSFSTSQQFDTNYQNQQHKQESTQLVDEQESDEESDCCDENNVNIIKVGAKFPSWKSLESALKRYKTNNANHRKRESKKVGCPWQLNIGFRKDINSIVVNKYIKNYNHSLTPYRKEFTPSLRTLLQDVLNEIKFSTQKCSLGAKAQYHYSKAELEHHLEELLIQYPASKNYLIQLWKSQQSWAKIYMFMTFCAECKAYNRWKLPNAHEYTEGYLEDKYNALQASLENIINMVNCENIIEIWRVSLFDQYNHNYSHYAIFLTDNSHLCTCLYIISNESIQASDYSVITVTTVLEFDTYEKINQDMYGEVNQVISIRGFDMFQARIHTSIVQKQEYAHGFGFAKSGLKFVLENGLVNEFIELIVRFIEGHTGVDTTEQMIVDINKIKNPKKLKHKEWPKLMGPMQQSAFQDLDTRQNKSR